MPPATVEISSLGEPFIAEFDPQMWRFAVGAAWLLATIGVARFLVGLVFVHRYRRQSVPINDVALLHEFDALCQEFEITRPVDLCETPSLGVAATIGWRRPMVLLPAAWREWTPDERRAVLAHELAHVAQRHFPLWFASQLAIAPHFYHPLIHWLGRRLRLEQEIAADQLAAQAFGNRHRYTDILAGLALGRMRPAAAFAGLGLFMSRPLMMRRIAMLREPTNDVRRPSRFTRSVGPALLLLVAVMVLGLRNAPEVAADEDATASTPSASSPSAAIADSDGQRAVTALIQIASDSAPLLGRSSSEQSWKVFSRTQAALLGSKFVMQSALRKPEIAKLPLVAAQQDPVDWLHRCLGVGFIPDTEILSVTMVGDPNDADQMRKIVDAVVQTYLDEIVTADQQRRDAVRDALARSFLKISAEIRTKLDEHIALADELGISSPQQRDPEAELLFRELTEAAKSRAALEGDLAEVQANFLVLEKQLTVGKELAADPIMNMLSQELMQLQSQYTRSNI